jgi:hypothetical protein
MSTYAEINAAIARRNAVAARQITRDSPFGAGTKKTQELFAINKEIAALIGGLPDTEERYLFVVRFVATESNGLFSESRGVVSTARQYGYQYPYEKADQILRGYKQISDEGAKASAPQWLAALNAYNTGQKFDVRWSPTFKRLTDYFRQGQAMPGRLNQELVIAAFRQWEIDAQPSTLDRAIEFVAGIALLVAVAYVGYTAYVSYAGATSGAATAQTGAASAGMSSTAVASASTTAVTSEVLSTGATAMTTAAQATGMDAIFQAIENGAVTLVQGTVNNAVANQLKPAVNPVQVQAAAAQPSFQITPMMALGAVALGVLVALALRK